MSDIVFPVAVAYDLSYDPNEVGPDLVVQCRLSRGPRRNDPSFDPVPGDMVVVGDDEEAPLRGRVIRREQEWVWVQLELPSNLHATA